MTGEERKSIIAQLALSEGVMESVFEKYTDEQLVKRINLLWGESDD